MSHIYIIMIAALLSAGTFAKDCTKIDTTTVSCKKLISSTLFYVSPSCSFHHPGPFRDVVFTMETGVSNIYETEINDLRTPDKKTSKSVEIRYETYTSKGQNKEVHEYICNDNIQLFNEVLREDGHGFLHAVHEIQKNLNLDFETAKNYLQTKMK